MVSSKMIHSVPKQPSKRRKIVNGKLGLILIVVSLIWNITPLKAPFYDWSVEQHDKDAVQRFKAECPNYPNDGKTGSNTPGYAPGGSEIADECGRTLFGHPGRGFIIVNVFMVMVGVSGIVLVALVAVRRIVWYTKEAI